MEGERGGSGRGGVGGKTPVYFFFFLTRNDSNLRPLVAKESHSSGLGKGNSVLWSRSALNSGPERFPVPKKRCGAGPYKNMGSSSDGWVRTGTR